ncbi:hypothetical protein FOCG_09582 [Fusarium oxysporum f. sp. radicis-lycopersici 26381]|uniref:Uncharacterized protein n=1 Tax=Fusarium oxysporum Fo47 TaxID=660027 RepID=W9LA92_FUSOX|nr:hypothetical protein FOZG_00781 [Fusarium oxysporum Fo47]EXL49063.1 hypothetical protein FOCG_09582 [Fusarium oxysporum f. sp. radicis-lycopersici 26381]
MNWDITNTHWRESPWRIGNFQPYDRDELDSLTLGAKPANLDRTCHLLTYHLIHGSMLSKHPRQLHCNPILKGVASLCTHVFSLIHNWLDCPLLASSSRYYTPHPILADPDSRGAAAEPNWRWLLDLDA